MTNHSSRAWRRRMREAALLHLDRYSWPPELDGGGVQGMTRQQIAETIDRAFCAGYAEGRLDGREPAEERR